MMRAVIELKGMKECLMSRLGRFGPLPLERAGAIFSLTCDASRQQIVQLVPPRRHGIRRPTPAIRRFETAQYPRCIVRVSAAAQRDMEG